MSVGMIQLAMATTFICVASAMVLPVEKKSEDDEIFVLPLDDGIRESMNFFLWTPLNPIDHQVLTLTNAQSTHFDATLPTKILVHGYTGRGLSQWALLFREEFLKSGAFNIITVDWEEIAADIYPTVLPYVPAVGEHVAELVESLLQAFPGQLSLSSFHMIGHSLGAHVCGNSGRIFKGQIPRISAMDPAGFLMNMLNKDYKVATDKAHLVDVIHTTGLWIGLTEPVGHVDFYPNSGIAYQPGCEEHDGVGLVCSHERAWVLYAESINSDAGFKAWQCESWTAFDEGYCQLDEVAVNWMGEGVDGGRHGSFYLRTGSESPFAFSSQ